VPRWSRRVRGDDRQRRIGAASAIAHRLGGWPPPRDDDRHLGRGRSLPQPGARRAARMEVVDHGFTGLARPRSSAGGVARHRPGEGLGIAAVIRGDQISGASPHANGVGRRPSSRARCPRWRGPARVTYSHGRSRRTRPAPPVARQRCRSRRRRSLGRSRCRPGGRFAYRASGHVPCRSSTSSPSSCSPMAPSSMPR
jgi:hypothetical protein